MYIVISSFKDLTDNQFEYMVGDLFPREGRTINEISNERLEQLTSKNNKKGRVLIKNIELETTKTENTEEETKETEKTTEVENVEEETKEAKKDTKSKNSKK